MNVKYYNYSFVRSNKSCIPAFSIGKQYDDYVFLESGVINYYSNVTKLEDDLFRSTLVISQVKRRHSSKMCSDLIASYCTIRTDPTQTAFDRFHFTLFILCSFTKLFFCKVFIIVFLKTFSILVFFFIFLFLIANKKSHKKSSFI